MIKKFIFLLTPVLIIGASILVFIGFKATQNKVAPAVQIETLSASPSASPADSSTTMKVPAPGYENVPEMVVNTTQEHFDLDSVLMKKYGARAPFIIEKSIDGFAQGTLKIPEKQEKWWLAVEIKGQWKVVVDGYAYVNCKDIASYNFPSSMVPVCWGNGTLINR